MASPVRIPGPESVGQVGIARDPGGGATAQQFGAGIAEAAAGLSETASSISQHFYQKRKAVEDMANVQRYELEDSTVAQKGYLNLQGQAGLDPDNFHDTVGATLQASWAENDKRLTSEGARLSPEARKAVERRRGELLQNFTLRGVSDAHNAKIVDLGRTLDTNLTQIGTSLAESGDIAGASEQAERALGSMGQLVDPANLEKARQATNQNLGASVVTYLNKLQDEAVTAATPEERRAYTTQAEALIDQAVSKGYLDPAEGAEDKRIWERNYQKRIAGDMEPLERMRALGGAPGQPRTVRLPQDVHGRAALARDRLVNKHGLTPIQAAGLVGRFVTESNVRPDGPAGDTNIPGGSQGIGQWNRGRLAALQAFAKEPGRSGNWRDFDTQIDFAARELNTSEKSAGDKLRAATTVEDATAAAMSFERPRGWTDANPKGGLGWSKSLASAQQIAGVEVTAGDTVVEGGKPDAFFETMPVDVRQELIAGAEREILSIERAQHSYEIEMEKEDRQEITKTGYDMMRAADEEAAHGDSGSGGMWIGETPKPQLTEEWLEANRDILNVTDYKAFSRALGPDQVTKATPPEDYIRLLDMADNEPTEAVEEVRRLYGDGVISKDVFNKVLTRAESNAKSGSGRNYATEMRSYVNTQMTPDSDAPRSMYARKLDALFSFDDWISANPDASREETRAQAQAVVDDFQKIKYASGVNSLPLPRFSLKTPETLDIPELEKAMVKTTASLEKGMLTTRQAAEQAAIIRRWMDIVQYRD